MTESERDVMSVVFDRARGKAIVQAYVDASLRGAPRRLNVIIMKLFAAAGVLAIIAGIWLYNHSVTRGMKMIEIVVATGKEHKKVLLNDGSIVYLNGRTRLIYPENFDPKERKVILEGDAFFDVKSDATRPFVVSTGAVNTLVLGTSFRIRSNDSEKVEVMVATGRVAVKRDTTLLSYLIPGEGLSYNTVTKASEIRPYKSSEINGINEQILSFHSTPFTEVATELEKWYGVTVIISHKHVRESLLTGEFRNAPVRDILQSMAISSDISYKLKGDTVYLR